MILNAAYRVFHLVLFLHFLPLPYMIGLGFQILRT
jgi:hypothetical protein